jgi:hypothetical protein
VKQIKIQVEVAASERDLVGTEAAWQACGAHQDTVVSQFSSRTPYRLA